MQILRSTPATLEFGVYSDGTLSDLDSDPTVEVVDANGDVVAGVGAVTHPSTGIYRATLGSLAVLAALKATWTGALNGQPIIKSNRYEIVGNLLFLEVEARGKTITGLQTPLADETDYPDSDIARIRKKITDQFEARTGRSWIRRYSRVEICGSGGPTIRVSDGYPRAVDGADVAGPGCYQDVARIISATIDGTSIDGAELVPAGGRIHYKGGIWPHASRSDPLNVVVEYEYGPDPVPLEANENGLEMALANLVPSDISSFAQNFQSEDGTITFGPGGLAWPTTVWDWLKHNRPVSIA